MAMFSIILVSLSCPLYVIATVTLFLCFLDKIKIDSILEIFLPTDEQGS